ncbi:MAG: GatB/YqeY domain-containing protein [Amaricoccus sp.]|uniref:GatB/YqeY domain-containing protein n=1 Tax=Amaricoccus sp. TaxID=1872485 RepID=UPI0039E53CAC
MIRERLSNDLKEAIKAKEPTRVSTLRLILAAVKDRDIAARSEENADGVPDTEILAILGKMIKQRQESARIYEEGGRLDLSEQELSEIEVIRAYLPKQMTEAEVEAAVRGAIAETGAASVRDMGKVMGILKARFAGKMDFAVAGAAVKAAFR